MKKSYTQQVENELIANLESWSKLKFSSYEAPQGSNETLRLSYKNIAPVFNAIKPNHQLKRLSCEGVDLGEEGYEHVLHLVKTIISLKEINLMDTNLTEEQKKNILFVLKSKKKQKQLDSLLRTPSKKERQIIQAVNDLSIRRKEYHNKKALTSLFELIDLHTHCEAIIPLASGRYKPEHKYITSLHAMHESAHVSEHVMHTLATGAEIASHLSCIISASAKIIEIKLDHRLIHQAGQLVNQLKKYEATQREHIYRYVILSTLLQLSTRIGDGTSVSLSRNGGDILFQWYSVILSESIACLAELRDVKQDISEFALQWSQAITQKFIPEQIAYRPLQSNELNIDWSIALKIQQIFTEPRINPEPVYLPRPEPTNFLDDFHKGLYKALESRDWRASSNSYTCSFFAGFKREQLQTLRKYHFNFIKSLEIINTELRSLSDTDSISHTLQLKLINACLRGNLKEMAKIMPWHKIAVELSNEQASSGFDAILEPLRKEKDGTLQIAENFQNNVQESAELFQSDEQQLCSIRKRSIC